VQPTRLGFFLGPRAEKEDTVAALITFFTTSARKSGKTMPGRDEVHQYGPFCHAPQRLGCSAIIYLDRIFNEFLDDCRRGAALVNVLLARAPLTAGAGC